MTLSSKEKEQFVLLRAIFHHISDAVYIIDPLTSNIIDSNKAGYEDLGMELSELLSQSVLSLQQDVLDMTHWNDILAVMRSKETYVFLGHHIRKDGSVFPVEVHTNFIVHENKEYLISIARDITERVQLENVLKERTPQLSYVLNVAGDGLWDWNLQNDEVFFSPQLKQMLGYGPHEMQPHLDTWISNVHPEDLERVYQVLQKHLQGEVPRYEAEYRLKNRSGQYIWVFDHGAVCERGESGKPLRVIGMVHNISTRKDLENKLHQRATQDELTKLLNRYAGYKQFSTLLDLAKKDQTKLSVALIDLDHFKRINDLNGHLVGDEVLKRTAKAMSAELRKSDVLLRWGGEEFLLIMPNTELQEAYAICSHFQECLNMSIESSDLLSFKVTFSGGIACYPNHGCTIEDIVKAADEALYQAKRLGRNQLCIKGFPS